MRSACPPSAGAPAARVNASSASGSIDTYCHVSGRRKARAAAPIGVFPSPSTKQRTASNDTAPRSLPPTPPPPTPPLPPSPSSSLPSAAPFVFPPSVPHAPFSLSPPLPPSPPSLATRHAPPRSTASSRARTRASTNIFTALSTASAIAIASLISFGYLRRSAVSG